MATATVPSTVREISAEEAATLTPWEHRGVPMGAETLAVLALGVGRGLVWSPCPTDGRKEGKPCMLLGRLLQATRPRAITLRQWHTMDGEHVVVRIS